MSVKPPVSPPTDPVHLVIRASAGSGKTFTLSSRYLKLLMRGARPQQILATTFTRKAADEILSRVLLRAARGARDEAGARQLASELRLTTVGLDEARRVLVQLVSSLHAVSVSTIDSFFNRIAQSFQYELDLPADAVMIAPSDPQAIQLRAQAIEAMLADDDPHVLVELLRRLHHDKAQRSVTSAIDGIVRELYDVYRLSPSASAWSVLETPPTLSAEQIVDALQEFLAVVTEAPESVWGARLGKALVTLAQVAVRHDWETFAGHTIVKSLATGDGTYYGKPLPDQVAQALRPLVVHAQATLVANVAHRTRALHDLLQRFDGHFSRLRQERRVQLFSDLPLKIGHQLLQSDGEPSDVLQEIYYRLDGQVQHLMLDEFQDTSIEQWQVLRPFAQEICAHGDGDFGSRTFFCVGDVKQAIYGWRGGCAELFAQVEHDLYLDEKSRAKLNKSYRSSQVVLDVANRVFSDMASAAPLAEHQEAVARWEEGFSTHSAARTETPGYVEFVTSTAPSDDDASATANSDDAEDTSGDPHLVFTAAKIAELAQAAPGRSIGVLVRTNATVNRLIYHLRKHRLPVSGEGGNLITDDPAVNVVLSALTLADHPGHSAAAFHVLASPLANVVGLRSWREADVADVARQIRRDLVTHGYAALIARWVRALAPACDQRSVVRLTQLVELADRYDPAMTLRTRDFVDYIKATPVEETNAANIRVMTVHRSKGLEFDIVVMPELEPLLAQVHKQAVWTYRKEATQPPAAVFAVSNRQLREMIEPYCPTYRAAYEQELARRLHDDLCALYVGMTRPRHALHLIAEPLRATRSGLSARGLRNLSCSAILRDRLEIVNETTAGNEVLFTHGDPHWYRNMPAAAEPKPEADKPSEPLRLSLPRGASARRSWPRVSPSSLEGQGRVRAADLLATQTSMGRQRGSVIHRLFETLEWLEQGVADDATLRQAACQPNETMDDAWLGEQIAQFRQMLAQPSVVEALSRPTLDTAETADLWRERAFAVRLDDRLLRGTFDRVTVVYRDAKPVRARLIDFKSDRPDSNGGFDEAIEQYRPQIAAYRRALATMLRLPAHAIVAQLLFVSTGTLVDIPAEGSELS